MNRAQANTLLNAVRRGGFATQRDIDAALRATGDLKPDAAPISRAVLRRRPNYAGCLV
jgi:hypothetical protein